MVVVYSIDENLFSAKMRSRARTAGPKEAITGRGTCTKRHCSLHTHPRRHRRRWLTLQTTTDVFIGGDCSSVIPSSVILSAILPRSLGVPIVAIHSPAYFRGALHCARKLHQSCMYTLKRVEAFHILVTERWAPELIPVCRQSARMQVNIKVNHPAV